MLDKWVPLVTRYDVSVRAETSLLAALFEVGGVDINNLNISRSTLNRKNNKIVENEAQIIREDNLDKIRHLKLTIHFDTKIVKQYKMDRKMTLAGERLAISCSSPESGPLDFLLGVLEIPNSKGHEQALAIQSILEYYELSDQIIAVCTDTTASNTGRHAGANKLIVANALRRPTLYLHNVQTSHL